MEDIFDRYGECDTFSKKYSIINNYHCKDEIVHVIQYIISIQGRTWNFSETNGHLTVLAKLYPLH